MAAIALVANDVAALKRQLHHTLPDEKSSHLCEAIAAAIGFNTYAALLARLKASDVRERSDAEVRLLDDQVFDSRLAQLNPDNQPGWWSHPTEGMSFDELGCEALIQTLAPSQHEDIQFDTARKRAWRVLMVSAVNAGLKQGLFTLMPGGNKWPGATNDPSTYSHHRFEYSLSPTLRVGVGMTDIGFEELSLSVVVNPTKRCYERLAEGSKDYLDLDDGDATAFGWLERQRGAWLQSSPAVFHSRRLLLDQLAAIEVRPAGFGDRGRVVY